MHDERLVGEAEGGTNNVKFKPGARIVSEGGDGSAEARIAGPGKGRAVVRAADAVDEGQRRGGREVIFRETDEDILGVVGGLAEGGKFRLEHGLFVHSGSTELWEVDDEDVVFHNAALAPVIIRQIRARDSDAKPLDPRVTVAVEQQHELAVHTVDFIHVWEHDCRFWQTTEDFQNGVLVVLGLRLHDENEPLQSPIGDFGPQPFVIPLERGQHRANQRLLTQNLLNLDVDAFSVRAERPGSLDNAVWELESGYSADVCPAGAAGEGSGGAYTFLGVEGNKHGRPDTQSRQPLTLHLAAVQAQERG